MNQASPTLSRQHPVALLPGATAAVAVSAHHTTPHSLAHSVFAMLTMPTKSHVVTSYGWVQVRRKRAAHAGMAELAATQNRPMITIGG